tara:strand:+ start:275 stop:916 length:642 start_codon:yes stop_codon:yes gene_type:complete
MNSDNSLDEFKERSLEQLPKELQTTFYVDNPQKIFWLSMITGGFYPALWFYRHWRHFKRRAIECKKLNIENPIKYEKDSEIAPFWSTFFCGYYIVGTARRIRDRLKYLGSSEFSTGPWWAFWLFSLSNLPTWRYETTENISQNVVVLVVDLIGISIASWQITRLQIKANQSILLSHERESISRKKLKRWDLIFLIVGVIFTLIYIVGSILPPI